MQIIWNYDAAPQFHASLKALASDGIDVTVCPESDDVRLFELLPHTDVLWHCLRPVDAQLFEAAPRLRLVQKIGVGLNTIDLALAESRGIAVCNMPGTNSRAVAEHALGLMLAVLRQTNRFDGDVRAGNGWQWDPQRQDALGEISGRTVGLVGFGGVSRLLAPILEAIGAEVIYTTRHPPPDDDRHQTLDQLLAASDIVSLHVPLTEETEKLVNAERLTNMKRGAILINTARGGLVDEAALLDALVDGRLSGAGLDVFAAEPAPAHHPLFSLSNVVLSPHVAWLTRETLERSLTVAVENCRRLEAGEPLLHQVI